MNTSYIELLINFVRDHGFEANHVWTCTAGDVIDIEIPAIDINNHPYTLVERVKPNLSEVRRALGY